MRRVVAIAGFVTLGAAGCGGGPGRHAAPPPSGAAAAWAWLRAAADPLLARPLRRSVGLLAAVRRAGHSFGGRMAVEFASLEPRVRAVMTMAGGADRGTTSSITAPTLMMAGGRDTVDPVRLSEASLRALPRTTPKGLLVVPRAGHGGLIDGCAAIGACEQVASGAAAFFLTYLAHAGGHDEPLKGLMSR